MTGEGEGEGGRGGGDNNDGDLEYGLVRSSVKWMDQIICVVSCHL